MVLLSSLIFPGSSAVSAVNLFTYGTLMFDPVWSAVVAGTYTRKKAVLHGYRRRTVHGESYPALIPGTTGDIVPGLLWLDIDAPDLEKLDRYEGECYQRETCECLVAEEGFFPGQVYIFKEQYLHRVEDREWDPTRFIAE